MFDDTETRVGFSDALKELCTDYGMAPWVHRAMMASISSRRSGSRPIYLPEYAAEAKTLCEVFAAVDSELATFFRVSIKTIGVWKTQYPEFREAVKLGKDAPNERVKTALYHKAVGYHIDSEKLFMPKGASDKADIIRVKTKEYIPPDATAAKMWLTNRDPANWTERKVVGIGGEKPGDPVRLQDVPPELTEADLAYLRDLL